MGATQNINAVPSGPGGPGRGDSRPFFRDEVPDNAGADTAQFDLQAVNDYDGYDDYEDFEGYDGRDTDRGGKKRGILMIAGFVALLVIAGGGMFFFASGGLGSGGPDAATTVANEDDDPGQLAAEVLFPDTVDVEGSGTFTRVAIDDNSEDCSVGAHGEYGQVLTDNECRQLVRASYLSEDENHAVTVGVAAMPTGDAAETVLGAQNLDEAQWFSGLADEEGTPAERLGYSGGYATSAQWGRYVLFSLATNSDGTDDAEAAEDADSEADGELRTIGEGFLDDAFDQLSDDRA